jgi:hypothetical protein
VLEFDGFSKIVGLFNDSWDDFLHIVFIFVHCMDYNSPYVTLIGNRVGKKVRES